MIEIPEAIVLVKQLNDKIIGNRIRHVTAAGAPHKLAFYYEDPKAYAERLEGETITKASSVGGLVEIKAGKKVILFGDGVGLRYHESGASRPERHQLLIEFQDGSALSAAVQMYGGIWCFPEGEFKNPYYEVAKEKPSPLLEMFSQDYFNNLLSSPETMKLSLKAFLATEQRIPGLGNGVLQDILWTAGLHAKRKVKTLAPQERETLFSSLVSTLNQMAEKGGRDTEKDLLGRTGGYETVMNKNHLGDPCPVCGEIIRKEAYMGGSIYFCPGCQKL